MTRALIDANVFLYALGTEHRYRQPCRELVSGLARGELSGEVSVEILQELVHVRRRRGEQTAADRAREIVAWGIPVHAFEPADLDRALVLLDEHPTLRTRDAVHAATAVNRGIRLIISTDSDFDSLPDIDRIDPAGGAALDRLG